MMMDRRSWLWRRKSSEKSPAETESSGSISSLSERFSDDQTQASQSPEVTSKPVTAVDEEALPDNVEVLRERLSAALISVSAKEQLVNQHAKVAEEAVSGWEKAENEVSTLKQQLEAAAQKNSGLEDRVGHLDGALKECVRQLRQAREEQEQKIQEAVTKKTQIWESSKSDLESQLIDLQKQLQTAKAEAAVSADLDLHLKLEAAEKENSDLRLELLSRIEELEIRIIERDLSIQAAETASKQNLENVKKVAKLEAECRRLKAGARKASPMNDQKSFTTSSLSVESLPDSQADSGERLLAVENEMNRLSRLETSKCEANCFGSWTSSDHDKFKNDKALGRNIMVSSVEINLMDDFLEMERLAASPDTETRSYNPDAGSASDLQNAGDSTMKVKLESMAQENAELTEKLEKTEAKKVELETALAESRKQVEALTNCVKESELKLVELQTQLALANNSKQALEVEMKTAKAAKEVVESQLRIVEAEMKTQSTLAKRSRQAVEEELKTANAAKESAESRLKELEAEMKTQLSLTKRSRQAVEEELKKVNATKEAAESRLRDLEAEMKTQLSLAKRSKQDVEDELKTANAAKEVAETQLRDLEGEMKTLCAKVASLEEEVEKERALSAEYLNTSKKLKDELTKIKYEAKLQQEAHLQHPRNSNGEFKIKQEKELAAAASKYAECQKTIASLGKQLRSLVALDDFLMDSENPLDLTSEGLHSSAGRIRLS